MRDRKIAIIPFISQVEWKHQSLIKPSYIEIRLVPKLEMNDSEKLLLRSLPRDYHITKLKGRRDRLSNREIEEQGDIPSNRELEQQGARAREVTEPN